MLYLAQAVIVADLDDEGVLALFIGLLGDELCLDLLGRAAEGHFVELRHVVAEAEAKLRALLDEEVDDAHDALGGLVKGVGRGVALAHHHENAAAVGRLAREKAVEEEAREVKARDRERVDRCAAAGYADNADAVFDRRADELVAGVGDAGRARVGDDGDILAGGKLLDEPLGLAVFVELVVGAQAVAADAELVEQHHAAAGVLGGDDVGARQDLAPALGHIARVADGRCDDIKGSCGLLFVHKILQKQIISHYKCSIAYFAAPCKAGEAGIFICFLRPPRYNEGTLRNKGETP